MNSRILFTYFFLIASLWSCDKENQERKVTCVQQDEYDYLDGFKIDTMCTSDICTQYLSIWKELIQEKNNLSQEFLDTHIELCYSKLHSWRDGISFKVCYKLQIGWAIVYTFDKFIIKINAENLHYASLDLPRGTYLTKDKVKVVVDNRVFGSRIKKITNANDLQYLNMESALNDLIEFSGVNILCLSRIELDDDTGNLILEAYARYVNEENLGIKGTVDLISGEKDVHDRPWIISSP
jgi:hypothetical protein